MSLDTLQYFFQRVPRLDYVSPPICEVEFSSSATPTIVLNPHARKLGPTGLEYFVQDGRIFLRWNNYPGAICFSIYKAVDELDPFGDFHLVAECVQSPFDIDSFGPGLFRVTAITLEGETAFSEPISVPEGGGGCEAPTVLNGPLDVEKEEGDTAIFFVDVSGTQPFIYQWKKDGIDIPGANSSQLNIEDVMESDEGLYSVHVENACGFAQSPDAELTVDAFSCGAVPASIQAAVWEDKEVLFPFGGDIVGGDGSFSITVTTSSTAASKITSVCNPGAEYEIEVKLVWNTSGTVVFNPGGYPVNVVLIINGIPKDEDIRDAVTGPFTDMVVNAMLPATSTSAIEIRVGFLAIGAPSATFDGTLTVRPLTPP
jgi:hypothetical protein